MRLVKTPFIALIVPFMLACSHPLEPRGNGDILSTTGDRYCYLEDYQQGKKNCAKNMILDAYHETYFAVPRPGWQFDRWENYCTDGASGSQCSFDVPAESVKQFWGQVMPPLVAVFTEIPPPSFDGTDRDGNLGFDSARSIADSGVFTDTVSATNEADYFVFTASERANYSVSLEFSNPDMFLYWYNDNEHKTLVGESRDSGAVVQEITQKTLEKGRVYYLGVQAKSQTSEQEYRISLSKKPVPKPPHVGNLSLVDGLSHIIDYDITGQLYISNFTTVGIVDGDINSLLADTVYDLRIAGGRIPEAFAYGGTIEISGGRIDVLDSEATNSRVTGGQIGDFYNISSSWDISGGTFSGIVQVRSDGTGVFHISGGDFQGGFKTNHIQGQSKNFVFYGDLKVSVISVFDDVHNLRIAGTLADGSPIDQMITCINYDFFATPGSLPCDAVEIHPK